MNEDVTERKLSESRLKLAKEILETLNRPNDIVKLIEDILGMVKEHTRVEAIGIRLKEGEDYPYSVTNGFSADFLETEKRLCARDDAGAIARDAQGHPILECLCGDVLCERTDSALPFFTAAGSFWTNSTTELMASTSNDRKIFRNRCNSEGYESVTLIPLRARGEIIGLLQLNDSRPNAFSPERIHFFEGIAASIGVAVSRLRSSEALSESFEKLRRSIDDTIRAMGLIWKQETPIPQVTRRGSPTWLWPLAKS
ncbi:MAG: GAF domain-containing protein [Proteobacteria bacterium]|nr:GAF domain-containing protein [Pseudomonadota bacterium]